MILMPEFIKSEYFVPEPDNWHLLDGAPDEIVKEFEEYMDRKKKAEENDIDL